MSLRCCLSAPPSASLRPLHLVRPLLAAVRSRVLAAVLIATAASSALAGASTSLGAQQLPAPTKEEVERATTMVEHFHDDLKKNYYDSTFHGVDLEARKRETIARIAAAKTGPEAFAQAADFLASLNDSHTFMYGFDHKNEVHYGYTLKLVGDSCYFWRVTPGSDAAAKGIARGDRLVKIDGNVPTRRNFFLLQYVYHALSPRLGAHLTVEHVDGRREELDVKAKVTPGRAVWDWTSQSDIQDLINESERANDRLRHRTRPFGDSVLVWRMPQFVYGDDAVIDRIVKRAKGYRGLILDLRENPGGAVATEARLLGNFFDTTIVSTVWHMRDSTRTERVQPVSKDPYRGMLVILIDAQSASAAEITARTMQIEGRAIVVGDRSAGAVQTSLGFTHRAGFTKYLPYGASITIADLTMSDGSRLEGVGVVPDQIVLPTGADMAAGRDPQMARALAIVGVTITPEQAAHVIRGGQDEDP
ncbi:MAG TPA: S41 family peptidase [Gemmatimonadaceae bacterium]|nr:S41 family peptidase [Gemmatimonadaceae bacterium]